MWFCLSDGGDSPAKMGLSAAKARRLLLWAKDPAALNG